MGLLNKRGAELSLNIIIIAIIVLLVLVVISLIFTNKLGAFTKKSGSCEALNGVCVAPEQCTGEFAKVIAGTCTTQDAEGNIIDDPDSVCCLTIG